MRINNIDLLLVSSSYEMKSYQEYADTNAIFCSENPSFGGFSYSYASSILEMLFPGEDENTLTHHINNISSHEMNLNNPVKICTPVIINNREDSKRLMNKILSFCGKNHLKKIVMTHFIRISANNYNQNLEGILDALCNYRTEDEISLIIPVDETQFESFKSFTKNYLGN